MKLQTLIHILIGIVCIGLLPKTQAVSPPPDGGYPGGNTAEGTSALLSRTSGTYNTAVGIYSILSLTDGNFNTGIGAAALLVNTGGENTATGAGALLSNSSGANNTANGAFALFSNTTGNFNTANGAFALSNTSTGNFNTALGLDAGINQDTGSNNIYISDSGLAGESNVIAIGNVPPSLTPYQKFYVGAVFGVTTGSGTALPVIVDDNGQLGTAPSAARFKKEIKPMDKASEAILSLKPVTFHYKSDTADTPQFGLIAEEVARINPDLVVRDPSGEIYTVRYEAVNAMLLNEFLKEHKKVEELKNDFQSTVALQKKQIQALTAQLKQQAEQIKEVHAQSETIIAATEVALNNP